MRWPRTIPVNRGTRVKVTHLDPTFNTAFIRAAIPVNSNALRDRIAPAFGRLTEYLWTSMEYFLVELDNGDTAVHSHAEVVFIDERVYLPDCKECQCFAVSHVPTYSTKLRIKCLACKKCEGYVHPTESRCSSVDPNFYYDPERGHFEPIEPEDTRD